jgi:crossover junction endodeoxyribonuclease RuvC
MSERKIMGIDPSTHCGVAVVSREKVEHISTIHVPKDAFDYRIARIVEIALRTIQQAIDHRVQFAVIEGYIHAGRFVNSMQYEIGAIVRSYLWSANIPVVEVTPTALKKFATGAGRADKKQMVAAAHELWGYDGKDDNQADALALAYMGLTLDGATGFVPEDRLDTVAKLGKFLL